MLIGLALAMAVLVLHFMAWGEMARHAGLRKAEKPNE
jgi:hypothetical protein